MRIVALGLLLAGTAHAANWSDPDNGCGTGAAFAKSGKVADLPGCSGKVPKDAPAVELLLRDAKRSLADAEELLDKNKVDKMDKVDALLKSVEEALSKPPPLSPELPDRWEQAQPLYTRTIASFKQRRNLAPSIEKLRFSLAEAAKAGKNMETDPAIALAAAKTCVAAFDPPRAAGVPFSLEVELEPGKPRALKDSMSDCERQIKAAEPLVKAKEKAAALAAAQAKREAAAKAKAEARAAKAKAKAKAKSAKRK
jgi:hypothetical protein